MVPLKVEDIVNFFYLLYESVRGAIQSILENTIVRADPTLALKFADAMTMLVTITAVLLVFEFVTAAKKIIRIIVVLGWILLIASMVIALYTGA